MLKQGLVHETLSDLSSGPAALPPLHNLPQWSRINTLDKARYPKPFLKDRLQPLPNTATDMETNVVTSQREGSPEHDASSRDSHNINPALRIQHLEKSIKFLRDQHHEVLSHLHEEIDKLKRDNKELQFRLVMIQKMPSSPTRNSASKRKNSQEQKLAEKGATDADAYQGFPTQEDPSPAEDLNSHSPVSEEKIEELKLIFLEEEMKELKKALKDEKHKNHYLQQLLERAEARMAQRAERNPVDTSDLLLQGDTHNPQAAPAPVHIPSPSVSMGAASLHASSTLPAPHPPHHHAHPHPHPPSITGAGGGPHSQRHHASHPRRHLLENATSQPPHQQRSPSGRSSASRPLPFNASVSPLLVHVGPQGPRPPTLAECEAIIGHLQKTGDRQAHELNQLKTDLRDVLYSHKWSPDAFLLAKAYIAEDDAREDSDTQRRLTKVPLKPQNRKLPDIAYVQKDTVSLPPLKQTVGGRAIERRKRTQILQKSRLSKDISH